MILPMKLTEDQVRHIAHLARLQLTEVEVARLANELTDILSYVERLSELDTTGVKETHQVTGLSNVTRPDVLPDGPLADPRELLEQSKLEIQDNQLSIKRMM